MTEPTRNNTMDETLSLASEDDWADDEVFIELTERVDGSADLLGGEGLELEFGGELIELSVPAPAEGNPGGIDEDDEIIDLTVVEGDGMALSGEETLDLTDLSFLDENDDLIEEPSDVDLGEETIDLTNFALLEGEETLPGGSVPESIGDETLDLTDLSFLDEKDDFLEEPSPVDLGEETIDLTDLALLDVDETLPDNSTPVDLGDETLDLTDLALLDEMEGLLDEVTDSDAGEETLDLTDLSFLDELEELPQESSPAQGDLGEETLELSIGLDDLDNQERAEASIEGAPLDVGEAGADEGLVDIDLLLMGNDTDDGFSDLDPGTSDGASGQSDGDASLFDFDVPLDELSPEEPEGDDAEGLMGALPDQTLVLDDEEVLDLDLDLDLSLSPDDVVELNVEAEEEAVEMDGLLDGLGDEVVVDSDVAPIQEASPEISDAPDEPLSAPEESAAPEGVLDLSDFVHEQGMGGVPLEPAPALRERRPPGLPEGTFDLSGLNNDEDVLAGESNEADSLPAEGVPEISDAQLERVVERVVRTMFKERIEELIVDAIGKNLSEDIEKMKGMIKDNFS